MNMLNHWRIRFIFYGCVLLFIIIVIMQLLGINDEKGEEFMPQGIISEQIIDQQFSTSLNAAQFAQLIQQEEWTLIDIRNEWELEETGVIPGIDLHKNVYNDEHVVDLESLPKDGKYLIYCAHGNRTRKLQEYMLSLGFTTVHDLAGGIAEWERAGYPLINWKQ